MPRETRVRIYTPYRLHATAWLELLRNQPFLSVEGVISDKEGLSEWSEEEGAKALLVDLLNPSRADASQLIAGTESVGALFLVDSYDLDIVFGLIQGGAGGCIERDADLSELVRALTAVGRGELALPGDVAREVLRLMSRGHAPGAGPIEDLTGREREVLAQLALGMSNKEIAQTLLISVRTVEAHLRGVFAKLGVDSRTEAALWAVRNGYGEGER